MFQLWYDLSCAIETEVVQTKTDTRRNLIPYKSAATMKYIKARLFYYRSCTVLHIFKVGAPKSKHFLHIQNSDLLPQLSQITLRLDLQNCILCARFKFHA